MNREPGYSVSGPGAMQLTESPSHEEPSFEELIEHHRRELHVHCYRMLASFDDAEDAAQETILRAWKSRAAFEPGTSLRAWLYRIATNVCQDAIRAKARRPLAVGSLVEVPWLQPYPDLLLDEIAPTTEQPELRAVERETIELAFLTSMQILPPRQRAAFIARDILGWPAADAAALLGTSVAAANSALERARTAMKDRLPARRAEWMATEGTAREQELLARFIEAHEQGDAVAAVAISAEDIRITMPPNPGVFEGRGAIEPLLRRALGPDGGAWRLVATRANRMPAAASYLRRGGDTVFRAFKLDVLRVEVGMVAEITTFGADLFPVFGLPAAL